MKKIVFLNFLHYKFLPDQNFCKLHGYQSALVSIFFMKKDIASRSLVLFLNFIKNNYI